MQGVVGRRRGGACGFCEHERRWGGRCRRWGGRCRRCGRAGRDRRRLRPRSRISRAHRHRSPLSNQGFLPILESRLSQVPRNDRSCAELSRARCTLGFYIEQGCSNEGELFPGQRVARAAASAFGRDSALLQKSTDNGLGLGRAASEQLLNVAPVELSPFTSHAQHGPLLFRIGAEVLSLSTSHSSFCG